MCHKIGTHFRKRRKNSHSIAKNITCGLFSRVNALPRPVPGLAPVLLSTPRVRGAGQADCPASKSSKAERRGYRNGSPNKNPEWDPTPAKISLKFLVFQNNVTLQATTCAFEFITALYRKVFARHHL